jgi:sugar lactone lactonase YvrE
MRLRRLLALAFAFIAPLAARAQNISTVAGGGPINLDPTVSSVGAPVAVRQDSIGNTYILDNSANRIYKIAATGQPNAGKLTVFAGNGRDGYNGNGGLAVDAEFSGPVGMCIDAHDNVWVADSDNGLMRKILVSLTGANPGEQLGHVYDIVGVQTPTDFLFGGDGGPMASANLHFPDGCGFDTRGNLYIADRGNNAIRIAITGTPFGSFAAGNIYSFVSAGDGVGTTPPSAGVAADGTNAASAALNGPYDVFVDANNNVFIGLVGNPAPDPPAIPPPTANLVRVIWAADHGTQLAGKIYTVAGAVSGGDTTGAVVAATSAALSAAQGMSVDSNGNLIFCDPGNNVVREVPGSVAPPAGMTPGNIYIIAGNFGLHGYAGDGNPATDPAVRLSNPVGTFLKANGDLLIADSSGTSIRLVDHATADISTFAGNGHVSFGGDGGLAVDAQINAPAGLATFSTFDLVIADFKNKLLRGVKASDSTILTITGQPEFEGYFGNGISATGATIKDNAVINTNNVWLDAAGNGYLADTDNCVVRKIDTNAIITTIAGTLPLVPDPVNAPFFSVPQCGFAGAGGPALSAKLGKITGVAADSAGNVYFADSTNNVIWVLWKTTTTTPARTGGNVYIVSTGTTLNSPTGMFVDSYDNVYFADTNRQVIRQISAATGTLTVFAGTDGSAGFSPDGTAATSAQLKNPFGVFVDGAGNVFISDTGNNVIREVPFADGGGMTKGSIYTVVGTGTAGFNGDGIPATTAQISAPQGMAQGPAHSLYFSDSANNRVRSVANLTSNPSLTVSKLLLDFGNQAVLITSAAQTITVKNTGAATITLNAPQITGTNSADFAFTNHCGATLTAGATCTVDVKFTPSVTAAETATLTISDTVPESRAVSLTGTGVVGIPGASVAPTTLPAFALQAVGTTSATGKAVTVTNNGTAVLNFTAPTPFTFTGANSGDFTQTTTCGATLAVTASCTITVKFAPTAAGTRNASLSIADNAPGSPQQVAVSGTAAVPTADLSGTTLTFPDQTINTSSATKTVTLTNNGTVPLTLNPAIAITGDFSQTNDCVSPIAAAAHCTITVTFTPTVVGARAGTITISDNASANGATITQTVTLSGNGLSAAPTVTLTGSPVSFANQLVGTTSATAQVVTLKNTSATAALLITGISIGGPNAGDFSQTTTCPTNPNTLAAQASCTISVSFKPTAAGARTALITIADNTSPANQIVGLGGNGVSVVLGGASTSQTVKAGATATYALQLTAIGGAPTDTFSVTFACSGAPSKATCTVPTSAVTVTPAAPTAVTVTVSTTASSTLVPFSEPSVQGPAAMRFLPLTIVSLLLCIAMMLAWMQNPAGRMRAVRFAVTACLVLMPIAMGAMLTGCASAGGSSSTPPPTPVPGTPAGTYTINVTSTVSGQTSTTPLTLIVQ